MYAILCEGVLSLLKVRFESFLALCQSLTLSCDSLLLLVLSISTKRVSLPTYEYSLATTQCTNSDWLCSMVATETLYSVNFLWRVRACEVGGRGCTYASRSSSAA